MAERAVTIVASNVAPVGGMERMAWQLARRLLARGWEVTVIARRCAIEPSAALRFVRLFAPPRPVPLAVALSYVQGTWAVWRHRRGLVHTTNPVVANTVDVINVQFCERAYREYVGLPRNRRPSLAYRLNSWVASGLDLLAERWSYRPGRVSVLACASQGTAAELRRFYPAVGPAVSSITNGVDRDAFDPEKGDGSVRRDLGIAADAPVALFVGGDWHRKGLGHAIDAVGGAPGWELVVVGAGDQEGFAARAAAEGAEGRVHFAGRVADPRQHFFAADALVFPTSYEAFSLVTLEAAAAGLALIVPRINGTEELVEDGVNGWFTEASGPAIAERLQTLSADRDLLGSAGRAARKASEPYDWERIVDAYEALYASLG